ncbi:MAG: DUF2752 domain-containing protein [Salinivirgaceae bacterium]|nr:DUF2752 domain-containing protein [Salinivirgaceae bacterium]
MFGISYNFDIPCFYKKYLGFECPWCGSQRALKLLLEGKFIESIVMFPALIPLIIMFVYLGLHLIFKFRHGSRILLSLFVLNVVIIAVNYIIKFF